MNLKRPVAPARSWSDVVLAVLVVVLVLALIVATLLVAGSMASGSMPVPLP